MRETWVQSLGQEDPLEKEMATHSNILAWRIPWTEEPGGLQFVHRVTKSRTRLSDITFTFFYPYIHWLPTLFCFSLQLFVPKFLEFINTWTQFVLYKNF